MLDVKVENCVGIDVGKKFLAVCVLTGPADRHKRHGIGNDCGHG